MPVYSYRSTCIQRNAIDKYSKFPSRHVTHCTMSMWTLCSHLSCPPACLHFVHHIQRFQQNPHNINRKKHDQTEEYFLTCYIHVHQLGFPWAGQLSRYSDWLRAWRSGDRIPVSGPTLGPIHSPVQWITGLYSGVNRPGRGAVRPPTFSVPRS